jgi:peptidoglycan/xylan/chitin deacetylase (PgdA/CDA1 family)
MRRLSSPWPGLGLPSIITVMSVDTPNPEIVIDDQPVPEAHVEPADELRPEPRRHSPLWTSFVFIGGLMLIGLVGLVFNITSLRPDTHFADTQPTNIRSELSKELASLTVQARELEDTQNVYGERVSNGAEVQSDLTGIQLDIESSQYKAARQNINSLRTDMTTWRTEMVRNIAARPVVATTDSGRTLDIPILIYHYTPADFDKQLTTLQERGYTTVDLDQVADALAGKAQLPAKPVVITYDDGFANQWEAFQLLKKHNMKATYYIITSGSGSAYCIGAGRRYDQPVGCGDGYMNWDQIKLLDQSGLITIADHTVDHLALANQTPEVQKFEIDTAKAELETRLGHPIYHFAYPYGSFNATTISLVQAAGFRTAVSTMPGTIQTQGTIYSLRRVRDPYKLP